MWGASEKHRSTYKEKKNSEKLSVFFPVLQAQDEVSLLSFFL